MMPRFVAVAALSALALSAQINRINGPINTDRTVTVRGQIHPYARSEFDQGAVEAAFPLNDLSVVLAPSAQQQNDLEAFLQRLQDPASPDYHQWVTPEQFANRFGPSPSDYERVVSWLESQGFAIHTQVPSRNWIAFGGTAALARQAFGVEIHRYQVDGEPHFANSNDPTVPEALSGLVAGFRGLHDFLPRAQHALVQPNYTTSSGTHYLAPNDVATIYNIAPLYSKGYDGTGQKIVVAGQSDVALSDIENFRSMFGLTANDPQLLLVPGTSDPGTVSADQQEADLDIEWLGAVARKATVIYVYSTNVLNSTQYAVAQNLAPVISYSYGECETPTYGSQHQAIAQQANAEGITWIAGSGDTGAAGCDANGATIAVNGPSVSLPASVPEVTGVGGTRFQEGTGTYWNATNTSTYGSAISYIPEIAWNDTTSGGRIEASGGGPSAVFAKPTWQAAIGVPGDSARDVPDIAMQSSPNHDAAIYCTGGSCANGISGVTTLIGGTSLSAPLFAGITSIVGEYRVGTGAASQVGLGNMNPSLYALAQTSTDVFHDVTSGNNVVACQTGTSGCTTGSFGYQAGVGYDLVTGLGSVNAYNLAQEYKTYTAPTAALLAVSVSPSTVTSGNKATVTVNLSSGAPTGGAVVQLSTSNSAFPIPASLTIAAGQSAGSIGVQAANVAASTPATITATYLSVSKTTSVTVSPSTPAAALSSVTISPTSLTGGSSATLTVALTAAAPTGGAAVTLSSNGTAFPVPASVSVAAGQTSVSVSVTTKAVTAATSVTVTATYLSVGKTASVTLSAPAAALSSATISPASLTGGTSATLTVALTVAAPTGGAAVTLSSNSTAFPVPASVTVAAGQTSASVSVTTKAVTAATSVTVTATYLSVGKTASVTLTAPAAALSSATISPTSLTGGSSATLTVALTVAAPTGGAVVTLNSNSTAFPVPASLTVAAGSTSASAAVQTTAVSASTSVTVTAAYAAVSKTATATLTPPPLPTVSSVTISPTSLVSGSSATVTITLSGAAPSGGASVTLTTSNSTAFPLPSSIAIAAGSTSGTLTVKAGTVTANTTVTATASYNSSSKSATVAVTKK